MLAEQVKSPQEDTTAGSGDIRKVGGMDDLHLHTKALAGGILIMFGLKLPPRTGQGSFPTSILLYRYV